MVNSPATPAPRRAPRRRWLVRVMRAALALPPLLLIVGWIATRILTAGAEREFPRLGELVAVEGLDQHVVDRGQGPAIVMLHGAFGGLQDFASTVLADLAEDHRCVLWDRPGHGYSVRPDRPLDPAGQASIMLALLRELGVDRPLVVGFSYGGAVALAAALAAPDYVRGVVLLNGPSHTWPDPIDLAYRLPAVPVLGPLLTETVMMPLGLWFAGHAVANAFAPRPVAGSFAHSPLALAMRPASYRANAEDVRLLKPCLARQAGRYAELVPAVTMVVSEADRVVSPTLHSQQLAAAAPSIEVIRIPGAGHQLLYTHATQVRRIVRTASARSPP